MITDRSPVMSVPGRGGLLGLWDSRDKRYGTIHYALSAEQVEAVRWWRSQEATTPALLTEAQGWVPPRRWVP